MWMCYVNEVEITDLKSGVEYLQQKFQNLQFDAEHEAVYGMGRFCSDEECSKLSETYSKGAQVCGLYLDMLMCETCLFYELTDLGLGPFLYNLEEYLSPELRQKLKKNSDSENDEDNSENSNKPE